MIIPLAAVGEPPFTASNDEARAYFANVSVGWPQTATALSSVAGIGILWFIVGLSLISAELRATRRGGQRSHSYLGCC
jgi:hypothetical protein